MLIPLENVPGCEEVGQQSCTSQCELEVLPLDPVDCSLFATRLGHQSSNGQGPVCLNEGLHHLNIGWTPSCFSPMCSLQIHQCCLATMESLEPMPGSGRVKNLVPEDDLKCCTCLHVGPTNIQLPWPLHLAQTTKKISFWKSQRHLSLTE